MLDSLIIISYLTTVKPLLSIGQWTDESDLEMQLIQVIFDISAKMNI